MAIFYRKGFFQPKLLPNIANHPNALILDTNKLKTTAEGNQQHHVASPAAQTSKENAQTALDKAVKSGMIVPRETPISEKKALMDPATLEMFGKLMYMGVPKMQVCEIIKISSETYVKLKRQHLENTIDALAETGVMGMVALGFDKLDFTSTRAMQLIAALDDTVGNRDALMSALRLLKEVEKDKIELLVKTGAIKVKKKVEVSAHMEVLTTGTKPLLTGDKATGTMVRVMSKLAEMIEEEDDAETEG